MARILISFYNGLYRDDAPSVMPCFYESFIKELSALGNELLVMHHPYFGRNFERVKPDLRDKIRKFDPDFALIFNNAFFDLSEDFDFPIYVYEVDSIQYYSNVELLKKKKDRFHYIVPQRASIEVLQNTLGVSKKNILFMPLFTSVRREILPKTMNISFIGTRFRSNGWDGNSPWCRFMMTQPEAEAIEKYREVLNNIAVNPFIDEKVLFEQVRCEKFSPERFVNKKEMIAVLSGCQRVLTLSEVADLGLTIFGTREWASEYCADWNIPLAYNPAIVYSLQHNQDIYNSSKLSININHIQAKTGFSWRVCDIMASDACLVSEYKPDFDLHFPGVPIPLFHNRYEARELCKKLLANKAMREDIVAQCNEVIEKKFRFEHMLPELEAFTGFSLRANNPLVPSVEGFTDSTPPSINNTPVQKVPSAKSNVDQADKKGSFSIGCLLRKLKLKNRFKLLSYLFLLLLAQIPLLDLLLPKKKREKLFAKIKKYWR